MIARGKRGHVADGAPNTSEFHFAVVDRARRNVAIRGYRSRRRKEAHEIGERDGVARHGLRLSLIVTGVVLGGAHHPAGSGVLHSGFAAVIGEQIVGDALFDVVGFA